LVGQSGSGKSTIASLLLRFYSTNSGSISIDGINIQEISLESLRNNIALVDQNTILFNDTIEHNIAYGQDDDKINTQSVINATEQAYLNPVVEKLEDRLQTFVGEDGSSLSGGQRQRVAIARALYKNAPILILDEATSALDNESEKKVQKALDTLKKNRTTIIIAHRLSTIENADKIIVLDQGNILEIGNHSDLIEKNGYYASLHRAQFGDT